MSQYKLSKRSLDRLKGVCPDLVDVVKLAITYTPVDFGVSEGVRSLATQEEYVAKGASTTMRSRHLTGHAVDVFAYVDGKAQWAMPLYVQINEAMQKAADELGVPIEWGGDWKSFVDGPHFQLPWAQYPEDSMSA